MSYQAKDSQVRARQLKVQRLVVPFTVVGSATSANVVVTNDEPSLVFFATEGVNNITAALAANETATFTTAASDANGVAQVLVKLSEPAEKVCAAYCLNRSGAVAALAHLGSATGITTGSGGGNSLMLVVDAAAFTSATQSLCLVVEYVVSNEVN